jgi:hypothetical protein
MVVFQFGNLNDQWFTGNIIETKVLRTKTRFYISKRNKRCKLKKNKKKSQQNAPELVSHAHLLSQYSEHYFVPG